MTVEAERVTTRVSRVIRFRAAATICALVALTAATAACGGDGDGSDDTTASPTVAAATRTVRPLPTVSPTETEVEMELDEFVIRPDLTRARPGTITFKVRNRGEIAHQFVVIKSDLPVAQLPRLPGDAGVDEDQVDVEDKIDLLNAGEEAELSVDLQSGAYVIICNLAPNGESHYLNGMYTSFDVSDDAPIVTPEASATP